VGSIRKLQYRGTVAAIATAWVALHGASAFAQEAAEPVGGEITVTARKRAMNLQDTPAAVTVIDGEQFRKMGLSSAEDVASKVPGFLFSNPVGEGGNPSLSLRGVGLNDFSDNNESPVAVYVDEVYVGSLAGQTSRLFDLERVEVLKGPQGTLYGRNSTGGLVSFTSKKPSQETSGYVQLGYGNYNEFHAEGAVGGPLTDTISARFSASHTNSEGTTYDRVSGDRGGQTDSNAARLQFRLQSGDSDVLLNGHISRTSGTSNFYAQRGTTALASGGGACSVSDALGGACVDSYGYSDTDGNPYKGDYSMGATPLKIDSQGLVLNYTYDAGDVKITSISSYDTLKKYQVESAYPGPSVPLDGTYRMDDEQFSQELRASGDKDGLAWVVGGFFYKDRKKDLFAINYFDFAYNFTQKTRAMAIFGQADWEFIPGVTATLGLRYNDERKSIRGSADGAVLGGEDFSDEYRRFSDNALSGTAGLSWKVNPDLLVYANVSRGFKSGGFNGGFVVTSAGLDPFKSEQITSYEAGIKSTLAGGLMTLNLAGFYYDYKNFQAITSADIDGIPISVLTNAGSATIKGIEAEMRAKPTGFLELGGGVTLLDTKTKDFLAYTGLDSNSQPVYDDLSGGELVSAPHVSANIDARVFWPLGSGEFSLAGDASYRSHFYFDTDNSALNQGGGAIELNARASWEQKAMGLTVAVWGKNINGATYINEGFSIFGGQGLIYNRPRTYGVTVTKNF